MAPTAKEKYEYDIIYFITAGGKYMRNNSYLLSTRRRFKYRDGTTTAVT